MEWWQAIVIAFLYYFADAPFWFGDGYYVLQRPIVAGFLVGLVMGDPVQGTIIGAMVLIVLLLPVGFIAGTDGLAFLWMLGILWAVYGAHATNRRRREFARHLGLIP